MSDQIYGWVSGFWLCIVLLEDKSSRKIWFCKMTQIQPPRCRENFAFLRLSPQKHTREAAEVPLPRLIPGVLEKCLGFSFPSAGAREQCHHLAELVSGPRVPPPPTELRPGRGRERSGGTLPPGCPHGPRGAGLHSGTSAPPPASPWACSCRP